MSNDFHIDLLKAYSGGDTTTANFPVKTGANSLNITASNLAGGKLTLQFRPVTKDGVPSQWYTVPQAEFEAADLDANNQVWVNTLLGEGHVRAVLSGAGAAVIEEMVLRPTNETEIQL